jgi:hypothetical protein
VWADEVEVSLLQAVKGMANDWEAGETLRIGTQLVSAVRVLP